MIAVLALVFFGLGGLVVALGHVRVVTRGK
jgi:hypothetical protein